MHADVARQGLRDGRRVIAGWTVAWLALVGLYLASWPAVRHNGETYDKIVRDLPAALRALVGGAGGLSTPAGYLTAELLSITGPLLMVAMGVLQGSRAVAGEEESGSLELLLAQPVTRTRVLLEKVLAAAAAIVLVQLVAGLVLFLLGHLVDLGLGLGACLSATGMLALLGLEALALAACVAAFIGSVGRSRAIAGGVALAAFLLHALGPSIPGLHAAQRFSPFATVVGSDPFRHTPPATSVLALVVPAILLVLLGVLAFRSRDLRLG
jgi:ABC-2 type transport system permease protein